jgi:glycine/D-amino acid oxidase-like deaminating enzyme
MIGSEMLFPRGPLAWEKLRVWEGREESGGGVPEGEEEGVLRLARRRAQTKRMMAMARRAAIPPTTPPMMVVVSGPEEPLSLPSSSCSSLGRLVGDSSELVLEG